jgi:hypothetical protein
MSNSDSASLLISATDFGNRTGEKTGQGEDAGPPLRYEPPAIFVIGRIRDKTLGSSSSGNKDANSQYYW